MTAEEDWSDESPSERARKQDGALTTEEAELLATLRAQPGRWHRYAKEISLGWWFSSEAGVVTRLARRDLLVYEQEHVKGLRSDVWVRALTPDERESVQDVRAAT